MENYEKLNSVEEVKSFAELWNGISPQYALMYSIGGLFFFLATSLALAIVLYSVYYALNDTIINKKSGKTVGNLIREKFAPFLLVFSVIFIAASAFVGYCDFFDISVSLYFYALVITFSSLIFNFLINKEYSIKTSKQCVVIAIFLFIWYLSALVSELPVREYPGMIWTGFTAVTLNLIFWLKQTLTYTIPRRRKYIRHYLKHLLLSLLIGILILIVVVSSLNTLKLPLIWDSAEYYLGAYKSAAWNYVSASVRSLTLCGHLSWGYTFLMQPGIWLFDNPQMGVHVLQIVYLALTIRLLAKIFEKLFPMASKIEIFLMTALFAFSPIILGPVGGFNPDYGMIMFFIWFVYAWLFDYPIWQLVFGLILSFSKEPSLFLYFGFALGLYIVRFIRNEEKHFFKRVFTSYKGISWFTMAAPAAVWLIVMFSDKVRVMLAQIAAGVTAFIETKASVALTYGRLTGDMVAAGGWADSMKSGGVINELGYDTLNVFALSADYIKAQLLHIFLGNFMWVVLLFSIIGIVLIIIRKAKGICDNTGKATLFVSLTVLTMFLLIMMLYLTHPHFRYPAPVLVVLLTIFYVILHKASDNSFIKSGVLAVIAVLFLLQTFLGIDPVTKAMGRKIDCGKTSLYNMSIGVGGIKTDDVSDYTLYNRQGLYWGEVLNETFAKMRCGRNTLVFVPAKDEMSFSGNIFGTYPGTDDKGLYYDEKNSMYSGVKMKSDEHCEVAAICEDGSIIAYGSDINPDDFFHFYLINPRYGMDCNVNKLLEGTGLSVESKETIEYKGLELDLYTLTEW